MASNPYSRVLLKISGEAFSGEDGVGIDPHRLSFLVEEIISAKFVCPYIGIVIGGGNIFRGINSDELKIGKKEGDYIGMLATVINGLALKESLKVKGIKCELFNSFDMEPFVIGFSQDKVDEAFSAGKIVIFSGGTGHPFFTTDTTGVLRALEMKAEALLKATKVDGIYTSDPKKDSEAIKLNVVTYDEILEKNLKIMDQSAIALARDNNLKLHIFNFFEKGNLVRVLKGEEIGSVVVGGKK